MASSFLQSVRSKGELDDDDDYDMISQLPDDMKHRILDCLDTRAAARTALLSTQWKDVWLRHDRLIFDWDFNNIKLGSRGTEYVKMVSDILMLRSGPVKEFGFLIPKHCPKPTQFDLEVWCRYLSRNGIEELHLCLTNVDDHQPKYKLPVCIFSCPTIKHLELGGFTIDFPDNARPDSAFSRLTSLRLVDCVVSVHRANGTTPSFPNLEELGFQNCVRIENLFTSFPKLKHLGVWDQPIGVDWEWFKSHFSVLTSLGIEPKLLSFKHAGVAKPSFPTALNLEELWLYEFSFDEDAFAASVQLLKECPNLLELGITLEEEPSSAHVGETISRMLENPSGWLNNHNFCKLEYVDIRSFTGSRQEMLFVKAILSNTPALDRLLIMESDKFDDAQALKLSRELLGFPRASPKAKVAFVDSKYSNTILFS